MSKIYPILPLRDIVVFPYMIVPLFVGREKSVKALEQVMNSEKKILLVAQKDASLDEPGAEDLYLTGTLANVLQLLKLPDGTVKVLVEGVQRIKINEFLATEEFFEAKTEEVSLVREDGDELEALSRSVIGKFAQYVKLNKKIPTEVSDTVKEIEDENKLSDVVASHLSLKISDSIQVNLGKIKAFSPKPGASIIQNDKIIKIIDAKIEDGKLIPLIIKPEGKKEMLYKDYLLGRPEGITLC